MRIVLALVAIGMSFSLSAQSALAQPVSKTATTQKVEKDYVVLTDENFSATMLEQEGVTIAYFWAVWCGPCRMTGPIVEELATEQKGNIVFGKLDVDDYPEIANEYKIRSIPTFLFFKDGELLEKHVGTISKKGILEKVESLK